MKRLAAALLLILGGTPLAKAANTIFYMNLSIGAGTVTGSILTDGNTGVLATADILDWNLVLNDGVTTFDLLGPLSGANSEYYPAGFTGLSATSTQLLFNFSNGTLGIVSLNMDDRLCFSSAGCGLNQGPGEILGILTFNGTIHPDIQFASLSGTQPIATTTPGKSFFSGQTALGSSVYYLTCSDGAPFGYFNFPTASMLYQYDMGFEGIISGSGSDVYLYDFASGHWWYSSSALFPDLYDFTLNAWIYYLPSTVLPGHYTTNPRYFANLSTRSIFTL